MNKIINFLCLLSLTMNALAMSKLDQQLIDALMYDNLGEVGRLIEDGASVNAKDPRNGAISYRYLFD